MEIVEFTKTKLDDGAKEYVWRMSFMTSLNILSGIAVILFIVKEVLFKC